LPDQSSNYFSGVRRSL